MTPLANDLMTTEGEMTAVGKIIRLRFVFLHIYRG